MFVFLQFVKEAEKEMTDQNEEARETKQENVVQCSVVKGKR